MSSPEPLVQFNQTWHKVFVGKGNYNLFSLKAMHFSKGSHIEKIHWRLLKIYYSKPLGQFQPHLAHRVYLGKGIQICWNKWSHLPPRGDNSKIGKKLCQVIESVIFKKNHSFLPFIGHLQGLSNYILAYHVFTFLWIIHGVNQEDLFDPRNENKNLKTLMHIYKTYPIIS